MKRFVLGLAVLAMLFGSVEQARANLIVNGGFETGDLTGWAIFPSFSHAAVVFSDGTVFQNRVYDAESGSYFAAMGQNSFEGTLSQVVATTPGSTYTLSVGLASDGITPNNFSVIWNGATLSSQTDIVSQPYVDMSFSVIGTGSDSLMFSGNAIHGYLSIDDVSLNTASVDAVPEPSSLVIAMTLFGGFGFMRARRRSEISLAAAQPDA